ncbi:zinc finger protein GAI-ASSOCIATED FACTOR 1-like isoform X2 [Andrographis paniculata]|uniref:zinc finger protein GAI-ASSOCIATED FACTOR 1-like isoform X2 n=1 Tax=Andrographis paniculata TaxID=175694 RepID=UPI0021E92034|nr:zinc finger protein GAI-ASSOCIATED FACTOR 1-like isoform X2 [Andrographis paniculata]
MVDIEKSSTPSAESNPRSVDNQTNKSNDQPTETSVPAKKKRNLPGMPDPDAEVIALSPKTLLATNRFVCEICNKGFQRDQNLQLHRRGHNLPWKLRQRTSKEVRKRVYICPEPTCIHHDPSRALGDLTGIKKHFCRKHGEKKYKCERCSKKYAVQSDWKAHMKTCGTREYRCDCGTLFSRRDSFITHRAFCDALAQESARSQPPPPPEPSPPTGGDLKVQIAAASPPPATSSPPPPPLTPSTSVVSPALSVQSPAELPENLQPPPPPGPPASVAAAATTTTTATEASIATSTVGTTVSSPASTATAFTFNSPTSDLPQPPPSPYSSLLSAMAAGPDHSHHPTAVDSMSLSLSSSLYTPSSLFPATSPRYVSIPPPPPAALSATALLQKAAQMGATTSSSSSFLRGLGLALPSASDHHPNTTSPPPPTFWNNGAAKFENIPASSGLMMSPSALFSDKPTTLDFLGLGMGGGGEPSSVGFSAFLSSFDGGESWEDSPDRKPSVV